MLVNCLAMVVELVFNSDLDNVENWFMTSWHVLKLNLVFELFWFYSFMLRKWLSGAMQMNQKHISVDCSILQHHRLQRPLDCFALGIRVQSATEANHIYCTHPWPKPCLWFRAEVLLWIPNTKTMKQKLNSKTHSHFQWTTWGLVPSTASRTKATHLLHPLAHDPIFHLLAVPRACKARTDLAWQSETSAVQAQGRKFYHVHGRYLATHSHDLYWKYASSGTAAWLNNNVGWMSGTSHGPIPKTMFGSPPSPGLLGLISRPLLWTAALTQCLVAIWCVRESKLWP